MAALDHRQRPLDHRHRSDVAARGGVEYGRTALMLDEQTPFETWAELGATLADIRGAVQWWVGDWIVHGERAFGESYAQAIDATGLDVDTLRGYAWVAGRIPPVRRRTSLSWSAHREVAALEPSEQDALLDRAEADGLRSRDLRRLVRALRARDDYETVSVRLTASVAAAARERAHGRDLADVAADLIARYADGA